ncbi:hypothetical protein [Pseudomonas trivialis]|uniref:hypothetical protein n=1 Tax=Pseudomonas trivialis TaxID=200450 RepID=UPI0030CB6475
MHSLAFTLLAALLTPSLSVHAQGDDELTFGASIITPGQPVWLLEKPYDDSAWLTARTFGNSTYGDYSTIASLQISCYAQNPTAGLALQINPQLLRFDIAPFEGKDASANGPLRITTEGRPAVDHLVNGVWAYGGAFQMGHIFTLNAYASQDKLADWASDALRGKTLKLSLAPAQKGGKPLTATFTLPANNDGLKKIFKICQSAASPHK